MITTLQIRVDQKIKQAAKRAFCAMGLDMSSGIKLYLTQVAASQAIPFPVMTADSYTEARKRELTKEIEEALSGGIIYENARVAHESVLK